MTTQELAAIVQNMWCNGSVHEPTARAIKDALDRLAAIEDAPSKVAEIELRHSKMQAPVNTVKSTPIYEGTIWPDSPDWRSFPSDDEIRACSTWWRMRGNPPRAYAVELTFIDDDLVDSTGDGPPLTLRSPGKPAAASMPMYLSDRWQRRTP
jgi:hypothetical protein